MKPEEVVIRKLEEEFGGKWEFDRNVHIQKTRRDEAGYTWYLPNDPYLTYMPERLEHWRKKGIEAKARGAYDGEGKPMGMMGIYRRVNGTPTRR